MNHHLIRAALVPGLLAMALRAKDPPPPAGGFPISEQLDQIITYADGYRSRYDVRLPDPALVAPPPTGWPMLLLVHGFSGAKGYFVINGEALSYARRGYVTVAYDVRGQGSAKTLNTTGGTTFIGGLEKADMVEIFHHVEAQLGALVDFDRLAVLGTSQGGLHAFAAAAWSERALPTPRGPYTTFPKISAVVPRAATPDLFELLVPDDQAFSGNFSRIVFNSNVVWEPVFVGQAQQAFLDQDFTAWRSLIQSDPWRQDASLLASTTVPFYMQFSWDDFVIGSNSAVDVFNSIPGSTPKLCYLSTGLHETPENALEIAYADKLANRWLDHFVKGFADEIEQQPAFLTAAIPADPTVATRTQSVWGLRQRDTYPMATVPGGSTRLYLRAGNQLESTAPTGAEAADTVTHAVPPTFGPNAWVATQNDPLQVLGQIPLSNVAYRGSPLAEARELTGEAVLDLHVNSTAPNLQLHATLFDEDPSGQLRFVAGGYRCVRGRTAGVSQYRLELRGTSYVFPAGHRLVLALENHGWHRPVGISELRTAPYFVSYAFDVLHASGTESCLELPLTRPALFCRANATEVSAAAGGDLPLPIDGSPTRAGSTYAVLVGLSGTVPGFPLLGSQVPLNFDLLTSIGLQLPTTPPWIDFIGVLDGAGRARPRFAPPPGFVPPIGVGLDFSFAAITFEQAGFSASSATQVRIVF